MSSLTEEQAAFGLGYLIRHVHFYVPAVVAEGVGPVFWLFLCGYLLTWLRDRQRAWFYTLWMAPLALVIFASAGTQVDALSFSATQALAVTVTAAMTVAR